MKTPEADAAWLAILAVRSLARVFVHGTVPDDPNVAEALKMIYRTADEAIEIMTSGPA